MISQPVATISRAPHQAPGRLWLAGLDALAGGLDGRGGALSSAPFVDGRPLVRTAVAPSAWAHELLGELDPGGRAPAGLLDLLPARQRRPFVGRVAGLRRRLRAFLSWHEEADGSWRPGGRDSGLPQHGGAAPGDAADIATSAAAGLALLGAWAPGSRVDRRALARGRRRLDRLGRASVLVGGPSLARVSRRLLAETLGGPESMEMGEEAEYGETARERALRCWLEGRRPSREPAAPGPGIAAVVAAEVDAAPDDGIDRALSADVEPEMDPGERPRVEQVDADLEAALGGRISARPWPGNVTCPALDLAALLAGSVRARLGRLRPVDQRPWEARRELRP